MTSHRRTAGPPIVETSGFHREGKRIAILGAAALAGLIAALGDGGAIALENPRSFAGPVSVLRFLAGGVALHVALAGIGGAGLALLAPRLLPSRTVALGIGVATFFALGVRVHVALLFGEPLLAPASVAVNAGIAVGAAVLAFAVARVARGLDEGTQRWTVALPAAACVLGLLLLAGTPARVPMPASIAAGPVAPDILLVTLDTTRADHLSSYGYPRGTTPALDRLARRSVVFPEVRVPVPLTNPSHSTILTGESPAIHGVLNNGMALPDSLRTVAWTLAERGWNCAAFVSGIPLKRGLSGLAPGFAVYDDAFSPLERLHPMMTSYAVVRVANRVLPTDFVERRARATCAAAIRWLRASEGPRFLWVHLFDPHSPYDAPAVLRERFTRDAAAWTGHGLPVTAWPHADYDAELRETDRHLEDLLREFDRVTGGNGVVCLTADHGEGLGQHGELTHGSQLHEEDVLVPLVLRGPGGEDQAGTIDPRRLETSSLAAFLRDADLPDAETLEPADPVVANTFPPEGRRRTASIVGRREDGVLVKLLVDLESGEERAYDLDADPGETRPFAPGVGFEELRAALPRAVGEELPGLDPETERRLRALGYLH